MEKQNIKKKETANDSNNQKKQKTLSDIANVRQSADEIDESNFNYSDDTVLKIVAVSIMVLAIVFGSLLLFHLL